MIRTFALVRSLAAPLGRRYFASGARSASRLVETQSAARLPQNVLSRVWPAVRPSSFALPGVPQRTVATAAAATGKDVDREKLQALLRMMQHDADSRPDDAASQLLYLKALIQDDQPKVALERILSNSSFLIKNPDAAKELLRSISEKAAAAEAAAAAATAGASTDAKPAADAKPTADAKPAALPTIPGSDAKHPIYVSQLGSGWANLFSTLIGLAIVGGLLYSLVYARGGGLEGMFGASNMTVSVEHQVRTTFRDVKGCEEAKEELGDIVEYLRAPQKFQRLGAKMPKGVLLVGPPGCGKTLMARALAGEAGVPFYYASGSEFEEMLVGVGARRVRQLFKKAKESAPCIIFIDEIDAVGGKRDDRENRTKMTLNQLLVELDGFTQNTNIVVIAATNMPDTLDPALTRPGRFDRQVTISLPDVRARRDIVEHYLGGRQSTDVNVEELSRATVGFSGADIFNMVNTAAIEATKLNLTKISMRLLRSALDHVRMGPHRKSLLISEECRRNTAFHEAGHALVALNTPGSNKINKATLAPRGQALGMVSSLPNDELQHSREELLAQMDMAMGGRVAEEMMFGKDKVTTGASNDFEQATRIATAMVTRFGFSESLGPMVVPRDLLRDASAATRDKIDSEVRRLLEESYARAQKILKDHRHELRYLAEALLEYETLSIEDIHVAISGQSLKALKDAQRQAEEALIAEEQETLHHEPTPVSPDALPALEDADENEGRNVLR